MIVRFADLSAHVPDPEFLLKYVRESTTRSLLYVARRSQRQQESVSADLNLILTELSFNGAVLFYAYYLKWTGFLIKWGQIKRVR